MKKIMILGVLLVMILSTYSQKLDLLPDSCWYQDQNIEFTSMSDDIAVDNSIFASNGQEKQYLLVKMEDGIFQIKEQTYRVYRNDTLTAYDDEGSKFQLVQVPSKWFSGDSYNYLAVMQTGMDPWTILMVGGEKSIYRFNESSSLNFWYFGYIDKTMGYTYFGPSLSHDFPGGYYSIGVAAGFTSTDKLIYAFTFMGEKDKFHWFANTEHGVWNWHRILAGYYVMNDVSLIAGSQAFLGPGLGGKLNITPKISLETMIHMGIKNPYFGSINDQGGFSIMLSVALGYNKPGDFLRVFLIVKKG